jgi:hypothetical protein
LKEIELVPPTMYSENGVRQLPLATLTIETLNHSKVNN